MRHKLKNKKILITGADGFIGSHLVEFLVEIGANVKAFCLYNSWNNIGWLSDLPEEVISKVELITGDIRDQTRVKEAVDGVAYVFHLASLIGIPYSYVAYRSYYQTNVLGTLNILEACKLNKSIERIIHTSTSEVYGSAQQIPINESHPLVGQSPYSASKIAADKLAESFYLSFNLPIITLRPFNTFGPRQTTRAVIPSIISQLVTGVKKLHLGNIHATRDFNYVLDTVRSITALSVKKKAIGKTINIGTGKEISIKETASTIMNIMNYKVPIVSQKKRLRPKNSEVNRLIADTKLMNSLINKDKRYSFKNGIEETINWIRKNQKYFIKNEYKI
ncbi:MAG: NAD-dependent dehydratase [Alphaproteobacteria bacterium TMED62]|nr:MAG: NAD-dependent dehydratase [Alphaproteobacteria bacterium TMED62]|tara:strand:+ start:5839 stop:6840 length:1002 start_codon:yes stop_codon:yes gene_type:complete